MAESSESTPAEREPDTLSGVIWYIGGTILLAVSLFARVLSYPVITSDYTYFVAKWFDALATHPWLTAFGNPFANYAPLYLYLLKVLTFLPVPSLVSAKTLSLVGDIAIALGVCLILRLLQPARWPADRLFFAFALVLSVPTVLINSSLWAQADALYGVFVVGSVAAMLLALPAAAAVLFGIALSLKLQAVFFLPVLAGYVLAERRLLQLVWIPAVFIISVIPAWLGSGAIDSLRYWLLIYARQAAEYPMLTVNAPSIFAFAPAAGVSQQALTFGGILFAGIAGLICLWLSMSTWRRKDMRGFLYAGVLCVLTIPFFLPRMHERYFYLADVFSVLYALYAPRRWYLPVLVVGASLLSYLPYLSGAVPALAAFVVDLRVPAAMMSMALAALAFEGITRWRHARRLERRGALRSLAGQSLEMTGGR